MSQEAIHRCTRCIVPASFPGIQFDEHGVCSICIDFDQTWGTWYSDSEVRAAAGRYLAESLNAARAKRRKYDCIVPTCGGRDSLYVLHLCKAVYGLNPLVFTIDNGFWADSARVNLARMVEALEVDHIVEQPPHLDDMFRLFLVEGREFCAPCNYLIFHRTVEIAWQHRIPLVLMGGCRRVDAILPAAPDPWLFRSVVRNNSRGRTWAAYSRLPWRFFAYYAFVGRRLEPLDYLDWTFSDRKSTLLANYGIHTGDEHSDCLAHSVAVYLSFTQSRLRKYGFGSKTLKYGQWIRNGLIGRSEALQLAEREDQEIIPAELEKFLTKLGLTRSEFEAIIQSASNTKRYEDLLGRFAARHRDGCFYAGQPYSRFYPEL